jgi:hypothetical protein
MSTIILTKRNLDESLNNRIKEEYYKGTPFSEIEKICNCSKRAVAFSLKQQRINTKLKRRYIINSDYFNKIDTEYKKYVLGLINADGCLAKTKNLIIQLIDEDPIRKLANELNIPECVQFIANPPGYANSKPAYLLRFSDNNIYEKLSSHYAKDLQWSNIELSNDGTYNWSFLLGFFDGDGCAYNNKDRSGGLINILAPNAVCQKIKDFTGMGSIIKHSENLSYWRIFGKENFTKFYNNCYKEDLGFERKKKKVEELINSYEDYKKRKNSRSESL